MFPTRNPDQWERVGRGSELQFFGTDEDLSEMLAAASSATATTIGFLVVESHGEERRIVECPVPQMRDCLTRGHDQALLTSRDTVAAAVPEPALLDEQAWILSGFVLVHHGFLWHGRQSASRFARFKQARHLVTRQVETNEAGKAIFDALRRELKKRAVWSSIRLLADGTPDEDDRLALMTDRAAAAALEHPDGWEATPGRRIR